MRCPHCGARISDNDAASLSQCPVCERDIESSKAADPAAKASPPPGRSPPLRGSPRRGAIAAKFDHSGGAAVPQAVPRDRATTPSSPRPKARQAAKSDIPKKLGPLDVTGKLGEGGMGAVYDGHDPNLDRRVAIKVLSSRLAQDEQFVQRFLAEARAVARVAHPNVCSVFSAGSAGDVHYFAMEFVEGESLDERIEKKGPCSPKAAIGYVIQAARGLGAAHQQDIVHRDVKPANLMLSKDDEVKVTDFGLAKRSGEDLKLTQAGSVMGSPHFMAPEQGRGEDTDVRADIYSLGATLYYLLTSKPPYDGDTSLAIILKHQEAPVPQITRAPPSLNRLLGKMMAKSSKGRYGGYDDLMDDLVRLDRSGLLRDEVIEAGVPPAPAAVGPVPAGMPKVARATPPGRRTSGIPTQRADDAAVLLSQLDSAMKRTPGASAGTPRKATRPTRRVGAAVVDFDEDADVFGGTAGAELGEAAGRRTPVLFYAVASGAGLLAILVIMLKPWTWGGGEDLPPAVRELVATIEKLRPTLNSDSPAARRVAVRSLVNRVKDLGLLNDPRAVTELSVRQGDPSPLVRTEVVKGFGVVCGERSVTRVHAILVRDASPDVRDVAARTLEKLTGYDLSGVDWRTDAAPLRRTEADDFMKWWQDRQAEKPR